MITSKTKACGVIGWPVEHSFSPAMHNAGFAALGLDFVYLGFAVKPNDLTVAIAGAQALGLRGLNVTIPHKAAALALCQPDALATKVGAVNTLTFENGRCLGSNTDVHGFAMLLSELQLQPKRAVVLGQGGAARAAVAALIDGIDQITVVARTPAPFVVAGHTIDVQPWSDAVLCTGFADCDLLVDATSRGLSDTAPFDLSPLGAGAAVVDLVVGRSTPLTAAARTRGLRAATGTAMLLYQGGRAFELWTGKPAPLSAMREALESALQTR